MIWITVKKPSSELRNWNSFDHEDFKTFQQISSVNHGTSPTSTSQALGFILLLGTALWGDWWWMFVSQWKHHGKIGWGLVTVGVFFFQIENPSIFKGNRTRDEFQSIFFGDSFDPRVEMSLRLSIFFWGCERQLQIFRCTSLFFIIRMVIVYNFKNLPWRAMFTPWYRWLLFNVAMDNLLFVDDVSIKHCSFPRLCMIAWRYPVKSWVVTQVESNCKLHSLLDNSQQRICWVSISGAGGDT